MTRNSTRYAQNDNPFELSTESLDAQRVAYSLHDADLSGLDTALIQIQVVDKSKWMAAKEQIEELFSFLTGRTVEIDFLETHSPREWTQRFDSTPPSAVSLFSGGLDSGTYAYMLSQNHERAVLSHTKTSLRLYGMAREFWQNYASNGPSMVVTDHERSEREMGIANTRGLVFLTNAYCIAFETIAPRVVVPENGPLMINPPVSRMVMPTKTANPHMIRVWSSILNEVFDTAITAETPFLDNTKAEVILNIQRADAIASTYSCFSSQGQEAMCGLCFACFVRMLSCLAVGKREDIGQVYMAHPLSDDMYQYKERNLEKATYLLDALRFWFRLIHPELEEVLPERKHAEQIVEKYPVMRRHSLDIFLGFDEYLIGGGIYSGGVGLLAHKLLNRIDPSVLEARRGELRKKAESVS